MAPPYYASLLISFFAYAIALLGFNLLFGYGGLLSFGHAMFLGFGAYGAAVIAGELWHQVVRARAGRWSCSPPWRDRAADRACSACAMSASSSAC